MESLPIVEVGRVLKGGGDRVRCPPSEPVLEVFFPAGLLEQNCNISQSGGNTDFLVCAIVWGCC